MVSRMNFPSALFLHTNPSSALFSHTIRKVSSTSSLSRGMMSR